MDVEEGENRDIRQGTSNGARGRRKRRIYSPERQMGQAHATLTGRPERSRAPLRRGSSAAAKSHGPLPPRRRPDRSATTPRFRCLFLSALAESSAATCSCKVFVLAGGVGGKRPYSILILGFARFMGFLAQRSADSATGRLEPALVRLHAPPCRPPPRNPSPPPCSAAPPESRTHQTARNTGREQVKGSAAGRPCGGSTAALPPVPLRGAPPLRGCSEQLHPERTSRPTPDHLLRSADPSPQPLRPLPLRVRGKGGRGRGGSRSGRRHDAESRARVGRPPPAATRGAPGTTERSQRPIPTVYRG